MPPTARVPDALVESLASTGIEVVPSFLDAGTCRGLAAAIEPLLASQERRKPGARRVFERSPTLRSLAMDSPLPELIEQIGGPTCRVVRAILFDKSPATNWMVPWHQDATIAVRERIDVLGFGPWAIKDDEHHCQPPRAILESVFTIRVHVDACPTEAGPLRVVRGSHRDGLLSDTDMQRVVAHGQIVEAVTDAGGVVLTAPLAVHSSPKATAPNTRRRVLHLDCTPAVLPGGLRWAECE